VFSDLTGNRTVRDLLVERAERYTDKPFLVFENKEGEVYRYGYRELVALAARAAAGFASVGIRKSDAVVVHLGNSPEFLITWFGLAWIGAVIVPSNVANTASEIEHILQLSEAVGFVTSPEYGSLFRASPRAGVKLKYRIHARTTDPTADTVLLDELLNVGGDPPGVLLDSNDVAEMLFTSGTTSRPKAAMLTHANLLRSGERAARGAALDTSDRCLTALPLFHVNAQSNTILSSFTVGATCVLLEQYRASRFWSQVQRHKATCISLVAMQLRTLLAQPTRVEDRIHEVRRNLFAINVLDSEKEAFEQRFGVELINCYGLTEAMTMVTVSPVYGQRRWPSIGLPAYDRQIRIIDKSGGDADVGCSGEIAVWGIPGRSLMKGYFRDPEATADAIRDGWLYTGDIGYCDEKGYLYFVDRKRDVIKRAGENVSASEVERVLLTSAEIAEAAVIGIPDPVRDEAVKAFIVPASGMTPTLDSILAHCRDHLAAFKLPSVIEVRESLPKTSIGKIDKGLLRGEAREGKT
jgi:crotonobetaine/carnitine-CoA ligase